MSDINGGRAQNALVLFIVVACLSLRSKTLTIHVTYTQGNLHTKCDGSVVELRVVMVVGPTTDESSDDDNAGCDAGAEGGTLDTVVVVVVDGGGGGGRGAGDASNALLTMLHKSRRAG